MSVSRIILDTNVVSYLMRGGLIAEAYGKRVQGRVAAISFITVGELYYGAENANWGADKRQQLEETLQNFVVVPFDNEIARAYGRITVQRKRAGRPISLHDAWIAACAVRHDLPLLTHNPRDFQHISHLQVVTETIQAH